MAKRKVKTTRQKTKAKNGRKSVRPTLDLLVICDAISRDPNSGKATLYGVYSRISVPKLRVPIPEIQVYGRLRGGEGEFPLELRVRRPDGTEVKSENYVDIQCKPNRTIEVYSKFAGFSPNEVGLHQVIFRVGKRQLGKPYVIDINVNKELANG